MAKLKNAAVVVSLPLALSACGGTPDCSSDTATEILGNIVEQRLASTHLGKGLREAIEYKLINVRQVSHDKSNDTYTCTAVMKMDQKAPGVGAIIGEYPLSYEIYTVTNDSKKDVEISYSTSFTSELDKAVQMFGTIPEGVAWYWADYNAKVGPPEHELSKGMCVAIRQQEGAGIQDIVLTNTHPDRTTFGDRLESGAYPVYAAGKTRVLIAYRPTWSRSVAAGWVDASSLEQVDSKFCQQ